ncbi:universal stress protein [Fulvivirga sp. M361]|uniref:universal stress protein n=1 Tax=Fulvivirga sp. M361 TaxID=2594266 RepID=UPI00117BBF64|nr:universal stress protein [Fulvivirga sp. M361]TRX62089.1 universal stress protein [Fulvivirga sp. M361]
MKKILVPTDFSDLSEMTLKYAVKIADKINAEIYLVHFMDHPLGRRFSTSSYGDESHQGEEQLFTIQLVRKYHTTLGGLASSYSHAKGEIHYEVFNQDFDGGVETYVEEKQIDLIIMGTTGEETLEEFFTGNHTEQVIERVSCPIISIKENPHNINSDLIVLGIDLKKDENDNYAKAVAYLNDLSSGLGTTIEVVHVADAGIGDHSVLEAEVKKMADNYGLLNYNISVTENNDKERGLMAFALAKGAGLLAVLTHSEGGFFRVFSHSTSEELTKESDIPVLTINLHNV